MFNVDTPRTPVAGIPAFEEPMRLVRGSIGGSIGHDNREVDHAFLCLLLFL